MFYGQCYKCGERWELGTASTCICKPEQTQREWVELTANEIHDTEGYEETREMYRFARAVLAKSKEKNT